jgi:hypothetical protein
MAIVHSRQFGANVGGGRGQIGGLWCRYMLMRVRRVAGAPAPQLELYGQSFTCPRALTLTNSTHNLKMLTEKNM